MKINKKYAIISLIFIVIIFFIFNGGGSNSKTKARLKFAKVKKGEMVYSITATGTIEPLRKFEIKSIASGKIINMPVDTGSRVRTGGLICQIDPLEDQSNFEKAKAKLDVSRLRLTKAKNDLKRQQELFKNKFISSSQLETYRLKLAEAKSEYTTSKFSRDNAKKKYNETWVTSPITGTILQKYVEKGQIISSGSYSASGGTKIAIIANLNQVYIKAMVAETDIARIKRGQKSVISVDAYAAKKFSGTVYKVEPMAVIEQNVTSFMVTVRINNPNQILKPGMNASVIITTDKLKDRILVPYNAVKRLRKKPYIFIKTKRGLKAKRVKIGKTNYEEIEIKRGLRPGMKVVVSGLSTADMFKIIKKSRKGRRRRGRLRIGKRRRKRKRKKK